MGELIGVVAALVVIYAVSRYAAKRRARARFVAECDAIFNRKFPACHCAEMAEPHWHIKDWQPNE